MTGDEIVTTSPRSRPGRTILLGVGCFVVGVGLQILLRLVCVHLVVVMGWAFVFERYWILQIQLADPDLDAPEVPLRMTVVGPGGVVVDEFPVLRLVRGGRRYRTVHRIRLSSEAEVPEDPALAALTARVLRVLQDSALHLEVDGRTVVIPIPLRRGPFVRDAPGEGRRLDDRPVTRAVPAAEKGTQAASLEIVSSAGRGPRIRVWSGMPVTFAARTRARGVEDLFRVTRWRDDITWTMERVAPSPPGPDAIIPGRARSRKRTIASRATRWGDPPSTYTPPRLAADRPGFYRLTARAADGASASVRLDPSSFRIIDVVADLRADRYAGSFRLELVDAREGRTRVPVTVRIVARAGEVRDEMRGVGLTRIHGEPHTFRSPTLFMSTKVDRPCRDRYDPDVPADERPNPVLKITENAELRIGIDDSRFRFRLPFGRNPLVTLKRLTPLGM